MKLPRPITNLIDYFERLPGIGPKTSQRLVFYLLRFPNEELEKFAEALVKLKKETRICSICKNVGETDPCEICTDTARDSSIIAVVSGPMDTIALERANFKGLYHVLHGVIDPLNNIGPEELFVKELLTRLEKFKKTDSDWSQNQDQIEIILATNTSLEGESTAMYISKLIRDSGFTKEQVKITRIARGLPVGGDIEYADDHTLLRALEGRATF